MDPKTQGGWDMWKCAKQTNGNMSKSKLQSLVFAVVNQWDFLGWRSPQCVLTHKRACMSAKCQHEQHTSYHRNHRKSIGMVQTRSDFQAWFFVYSASTSSGSSLDRRIRGSRSALVLSKESRHKSVKAAKAVKLNFTQ